VTIGMPVYNDVEYIEKSIQSILKQSFNKFELIISDDYSSDGSAEICIQYEKIDNRIKYIRQAKNIGISKNMKFLLDQSNCDFFIWAADDDIWASNYLEKLVNALINNPSYICAFSTFTHINEKGKIIDKPLNYDFEDKSAKQRIKKMILDPFDAFGYGLFRRKPISQVKFPVWVWPNKKVAWNNIYPTLFYYLAKGNYKHVYGEPLFYNRVKPKTNHSLTRTNKVFHIFAFVVRKFNLFLACLKNISKGGEFKTALVLWPLLFKKWVVVPIYYEVKSILKKERK
jgi:glycosyltransferase involved in cell wall biosynthesis